MSIEVKVGSQVRINGKSMICSSIDTFKVTSFAKESGDSLRQALGNANNCKYLDMTIEDFTEHEIIETEGQRIEFIDPGKDIYFIIPYYRVTKQKEELKKDESKESRREEVDASKSGSANADESNNSTGEDTNSNGSRLGSSNGTNA